MSRRAVRVPDALWVRAQAKADENDEYLSEVIRAALQSYVISESTKKEES